MDLSAIALQGLDQAEVQLETAAARIASAGGPSGGDAIDLSAEVVALLSSKNLVEFNLATLKVADETQKNVVDLLA